MSENIENQLPQEKSPSFLFPDLKYELGEIRRVAEKYDSENQEAFIGKFKQRAEEGNLVDLTEDIWSILENTDSYDIPKEGWKDIDDNANQVGREWKSKKEAIVSGVPLPAPMIVKVGNRYHKVSGNTRLMIYHALGVVPKVLIVDMN